MLKDVLLIISIKHDEEKANEIGVQERLENYKEIMAFIGLTNFYLKFVNIFSKQTST